jgi:hypothetical protein
MGDEKSRGGRVNEEAVGNVKNADWNGTVQISHKHTLKRTHTHTH